MAGIWLFVFAQFTPERSTRRERRSADGDHEYQNEKPDQPEKCNYGSNVPPVKTCNPAPKTVFDIPGLLESASSLLRRY
jgi:hypothetical protein